MSRRRWMDGIVLLTYKENKYIYDSMMADSGHDPVLSSLKQQCHVAGKKTQSAVRVKYLVKTAYNNI